MPLTHGSCCGVSPHLPPPRPQVVEHLNEGLADLERGEGWQLVQDGGAGGLRLQYRHVAGTSVHGFRAQCTLEAPTTVGVRASGMRS